MEKIWDIILSQWHYKSRIVHADSHLAYCYLEGTEALLMSLITPAVSVCFLLWVQMSAMKKALQVPKNEKEQTKNDEAHLGSLPHALPQSTGGQVLTVWRKYVSHFSFCGVCVCVYLWQVWSLRGKVGRSHVLWLWRPLQRTSVTSANMTTSTASM